MGTLIRNVLHNIKQPTFSSQGIIKKVRFLSVDRHPKSVPYYCYLPIDYNTTGRKATAASPF